MSDSFDAVQQLGGVPSREQMANAWWKVATTLDQACPGWEADAKSGADAACAAIRDMAGERALRQIEVAEADPFADVRDKRMSELTDEQRDRATELWAREQRGWFLPEQRERLDALFRVIDRLRLNQEQPK